MSRFSSASWLWKPLAAVALAALLAGWADAADVPLGSTTTTAATKPTTTSTATATTSTATAGPLADILALAQFLADELELSFDDPWEEAMFFFAVADFYFQTMHHQHAAGGTGKSATATKSATAQTAGSSLGSLTTVAK